MKEVKLGFENEAYFSRFFKNRKGLSPKEFTKRNVRELWLVYFLGSVTLYFCIIINLKYRTKQAQIITYQLKDISQAEYLKQMVEPDAPILAEVKGLISKVWLADEEKNTFGGFYLWENKTAMEDFMHSDLVKAVVSRPFVKNVSSVDFEVNQKASLITRGLK